MKFGDIALPDKPSKTEGLFVSAPPKSYRDISSFDDTDLSPIELGEGKFIPITDFCYLGKITSRDCKDDLDITNRIKRASNCFWCAAQIYLFQCKSIDKSESLGL